ncbi:MAG: MoaD/ThiS family protein [Elusimicrobia bacterium]|nr:MoaD/ThiS family protein [Elusimicrobiota bacterium]
MTNKPISYQITAHANLRHYLQGANEATSIETKRPLTARTLLKALEIPESEVMAVIVEGKTVELDSVLEKSCAVEIFPVLSGG